MLGDYILVAPLFAGEKSRKVVLPRGKWYDFYTGGLVGDGETIEIKNNLERIPLFVADGGIVPMIPPVLHTPRKDDILPLTVRHYGTKVSTFDLYDDAGETFDYERKMYGWTTLTVARSGSGQLFGKQNAGKQFRYKDVNWVFMTK